MRFRPCNGGGYVELLEDEDTEKLPLFQMNIPKRLRKLRHFEREPSTQGLRRELFSRL